MAYRIQQNIFFPQSERMSFKVLNLLVGSTTCLSHCYFKTPGSLFMLWIGSYKIYWEKNLESPNESVNVSIIIGKDFTNESCCQNFWMIIVMWPISSPS